MSSIGNFNFINMQRSKPAPPQVVVKIFSRPGCDGLGYRNEAAKPKETVLSTKELLATVELANQRYEEYANLKGAKITIIDDMGKRWDNVLILDVDIDGVREIPNSSKPQFKAMVSATWQVVIPEKIT